jgi:hypothetical protein
MIICGYPCIGKSSISNPENQCIDLDSSKYTLPDESKEDNWVQKYCDLAKELSDQGYKVFVSTHDDVRKYLGENYPDISCIIYPVKNLKDHWIERAKNRFEESKDPADERAYQNILNNFDEQIDELDNDKYLQRMPITDINYNLIDFVNSIHENFRSVPSLEDIIYGLGTINNNKDDYNDVGYNEKYDFEK